MTASPSPTASEALERRVRIEQAARTALDGVSKRALPDAHHPLAMDAIWKEIDALDADNTRWLKASLPSDGWFRMSRDGERTASAARRIVQHSPDRSWLEDILAKIAPGGGQRGRRRRLRPAL